MHNRCSQVLEPLTALICPDQFEALREKKKPASKGSSGTSSTSASSAGTAHARINLVNLMVMEDILQYAAEYGSQSQDCWKYVMRCVTFVLSIGSGEGGGKAKKGKKSSSNASRKSKSPDARSITSSTKDDVDDLDLNFGGDLSGSAESEL